MTADTTNKSVSNSSYLELFSGQLDNYDQQTTFYKRVGCEVNEIGMSLEKMKLDTKNKIWQKI